MRSKKKQNPELTPESAVRDRQFLATVLEKGAAACAGIFVLLGIASRLDAVHKLGQALVHAVQLFKFFDDRVGEVLKEENATSDILERSFVKGEGIAAQNKPKWDLGDAALRGRIAKWFSASCKEFAQRLDPKADQDNVGIIEWNATFFNDIRHKYVREKPLGMNAAAAVSAAIDSFLGDRSLFVGFVPSVSDFLAEGEFVKKFPSSSSNSEPQEPLHDGTEIKENLEFAAKLLEGNHPISEDLITKSENVEVVLTLIGEDDKDPQSLVGFFGSLNKFRRSIAAWFRQISTSVNWKYVSVGCAFGVLFFFLGCLAFLYYRRKTDKEEADVAPESAPVVLRVPERVPKMNPIRTFFLANPDVAMCLVSLWRNGPGFLYNLSKGEWEAGNDWHFVDSEGKNCRYDYAEKCVCTLEVGKEAADRRRGWNTKGARIKNNRFQGSSDTDAYYSRDEQAQISRDYRLRDPDEEEERYSRFISKQYDPVEQEFHKIHNSKNSDDLGWSRKKQQWADKPGVPRERWSELRPTEDLTDKTQYSNWSDYPIVFKQPAVFPSPVTRESLSPQGELSANQVLVPTVVPIDQPVVLPPKPIAPKAVATKGKFYDIVPEKNEKLSPPTAKQPAVKAPSSPSAIPTLTDKEIFVKERKWGKVKPPALTGVLVSSDLKGVISPLTVLKESAIPDSPMGSWQVIQRYVLPLYSGDIFIGNCSPFGNYLKTCKHVAADALRVGPDLNIRIGDQRHSVKWICDEPNMDFAWLTKPSTAALKSNPMAYGQHACAAGPLTLLAWALNDSGKPELYVSTGYAFGDNPGKQFDHWCGSRKGMSAGVLINSQWQDVGQHEGGHNVSKSNVAHRYSEPLVKKSVLTAKQLSAGVGEPPKSDLGK